MLPGVVKTQIHTNKFVIYCQVLCCTKGRKNKKWLRNSVNIWNSVIKRRRRVNLNLFVIQKKEKAIEAVNRISKWQLNNKSLREWVEDQEQIICVALHNVRWCAAVARCHILVIPGKPSWMLKARLEEIYLLMQGEDYAQNANLHFCRG